MEMVLKFVSKKSSVSIFPIGFKLDNDKVSNKFKHDWKIAQSWARWINSKLIDLMKKNEPTTKMKISFVVINQVEKILIPSLLYKFIRKFLGQNSSVVIITCKVDFQQPYKEWQDVIFRRVMEFELDLSTAPKIVQDKILEGNNGFVDITKELFMKY